MKALKHGAAGAYRTHKCRCLKCRAYGAAVKRRERARAAGRSLPPLRPPVTAAELGVPPFRPRVCSRCRAVCEQGGEPRFFLAGFELKVLCEGCAL